MFFSFLSNSIYLYSILGLVYLLFINYSPHIPFYINLAVLNHANICINMFHKFITCFSKIKAKITNNILMQLI